jgi:hypothetical protein
MEFAFVYIQKKKPLNNTVNSVGHESHIQLCQLIVYAEQCSMLTMLVSAGHCQRCWSNVLTASCAPWSDPMRELLFFLAMNSFICE